MDKRILDILCCPVSRRPLSKMSAGDLKQLNQQIDANQVQYVDGQPVPALLEAALISDDKQIVYGIEDGTPVMLPEKGIGTTQLK